MWRGWGLKCLSSVPKAVGSIPGTNQPSEMTQAYNYNSWKVKVKEVQSQLWLHSKLEASLDYADTRLKEKDKKKEWRKKGQCNLHLSLTLLEVVLKEKKKLSPVN